MSVSDLIFLRRVLISLEEYRKEEQKEMQGISLEGKVNERT